MIPSRYILQDSFPKTINGKIDRKALPDPECGEVPRESIYCEAETELERSLAAIWASVLNVPTIGRDDDFFQLGGSSLLVTRVIAQMAGKFDQAIPVRDFFANPTIASLCRHLTLIREQEADPANSQTAIRVENGSRATEQQPESLKLRKKLPRIHPVTIASRGEQLAGILYPAVENGIAYQNHCLVICNAHGPEHTRSARNLQQLAIRLTQSGLDVLRFDYAGTGNSTGDETRSSLDAWRYNVLDAVAYARSALNRDATLPRSLSVLGLRLGASLLASTALNNIHQVILWDPIVDGSGYVDLLQRYHQYELCSLTRYLNRRKCTPQQLLGYSFPTGLEQSIRSLHLPEQLNIKANQGWIISSKDNLLTNPQTFESASWEHRSCSDEIFWDKQAFTNRAFSSPHLAQSIHSILTRGTT